MTKEEYVNNEVNTVWEDKEFINHVVYEYFWNNIKDLSNEEFNQYLIEHGYEERTNNDCIY
tara:strand:- start:190 stop:372 length:183 start_codon:yes stop_codon:yes gene_type:complete